MKSLLALSVVLVVVISACGPSAEELEAKRKADSTRVADSLAQIAYQDSLKAAAEAAQAEAEAAAAAAAAAQAAAANANKGDKKGGTSTTTTTTTTTGGDTKKDSKFGGGEGKTDGPGKAVDTEEKKKNKFGK